jgi:hypothetical protein
VSLPPISDADLERLQARQSAANGGQHQAYHKPKSIAELLAFKEQHGTTLPLDEAERQKQRTKGYGRGGKPIHAADVPTRLPKPNGKWFMAAVHDLVNRERKIGDPSRGEIDAVSRVLLWLWSINQRWSQEKIAARADCSDETVRRVVNFLYEHRLLRWLNVMVRNRDGDFWRSANLYLAPLAFCSGETEYGWRHHAWQFAMDFLNQYAPLLGLYERPHWLNRTPLRPVPT